VVDNHPLGNVTIGECEPLATAYTEKLRREIEARAAQQVEAQRVVQARPAAPNPGRTPQQSAQQTRAIGAKAEHPVYDPQATIAQYKICVEQARAVLQAETQHHDIDAAYHWVTNGAICKARMDNALHESFRYQIMHQSSEASAGERRVRALNNNEMSNVPNGGRPLDLTAIGSGTSKAP
jgi:hypothetical protein